VSSTLVLFLHQGRALDSHYAVVSVAWQLKPFEKEK
jgi:hypothetical protein